MVTDAKKAGKVPVQPDEGHRQPRATLAAKKQGPHVCVQADTTLLAANAPIPLVTPPSLSEHSLHETRH